MDRKVKMNIEIAGTQYQLLSEMCDEPYYRAAAKNLTARIGEARAKWQQALNAHKIDDQWLLKLIACDAIANADQEKYRIEKLMDEIDNYTLRINSIISNA